jgi:PAS domain S-box-containing protein
MLERLRESIKVTVKVMELFEQRNKILTAISEVSNTFAAEKTKDEILEKCCQILVENNDFCLVWAGKRQEYEVDIIPVAAVNSARLPERDYMNMIEQVGMDIHDSNPAARALLTGKPVIIRDVFQEDDMEAMQEMAIKTGFKSCVAWPLLYKGCEYGVLNIQSEFIDCFNDEELDFLRNIVADISLALYSLDTTDRLKVERDFNQEIVDTVHALMVTISPCGQIMSLNVEAKKVTGFTEAQVRGKYWVDVLLAPSHRKEVQQKLSKVLKGDGEMNFQAPLRTRNGEEHIINWHGSIRPDITEKGRVGLVLFGLNITAKLETDQALDQALDQWRNIFVAIQDPALIISRDNVILDANPATFAAARKTPEQVIGQKVCQILHGGRRDKAICPLEAVISTGKSRILETELRGLNGQYMLTISPLSNDDDQASLLVARDLTEEELLHAEAMRAAQLASVGELAAGVAHEINNPINGIINYAQLLLDDMGDPVMEKDLLLRIIREGKRVGSIAHKLLDFSRQSEEEVEPAELVNIFADCISLIGHQLKKDGIILDMKISTALPEILCNSQQVQQVILNILSNGRYALNLKYPDCDPDKKIIIRAETNQRQGKKYVVFTITDLGTGVEHDIMDRLSDPFFSTKPKGEGTGLGLSISHGLIKENNGFLHISSELGHSTSLSVGLPTA